jgi:hypothetical protein
MRGSPGFLNVLQGQLEALPLDVLEDVNRPGGLEISELLDLLTNPKDYTVHLPYQVEPSSIKKNSDISIDAFWRGKDSLSTGETAHVIVVDDGAFDTIPGSQVTLLESQIMKISWIKRVWLLVDPVMREKALQAAASVGKTVDVIDNYRSFCLAPDNQLHMIGETPLLQSCGTGDLIESLSRCDFYSTFKQEGGKYIIVCAGNNVLGCGHPVIVGQHIIDNKPVTAEVTTKKQHDSQHVLCEHAGFNQLVEPFRLSSHTEVEQFGLISTGTLVFNVDLDWNAVKWKWHRIKKIHNKSVVVQYIRTLCDLTATFQTQYIETPRHYCYETLKG